MVIKGLIDEDFINYKKPSMVIMFPHCTFKCEKDCGQRVCQNSTLAKSPDITISMKELCTRYLSNFISQAIVCGGLEPMDSFDDLISLILTLRYEHQCNDDIVTTVRIALRSKNSAAVSAPVAFIAATASQAARVVGKRRSADSLAGAIRPVRNVASARNASVPSLPGMRRVMISKGSSHSANGRIVRPSAIRTWMFLKLIGANISHIYFFSKF